jgi:hypothetical protein
VAVAVAVAFGLGSRELAAEQVQRWRDAQWIERPLPAGANPVKEKEELMEFIQNILTDKAGDLLGALTGDAGYTADQADTFLPEAGSAVGEAVVSQATKLDLADLASASNIGAVLGAVDVSGLANKTGVSAEQSTAGLKALIPMLLGFIGQRSQGAGGLMSLLGGGKGSGALDGLKGMAGKLFR